MASITGSTSIDWASVALPELDVAGDIARVHVLLEDTSEALDIGSYSVLSASRSRIVFDLFSPVDGRLTYRGSGFGTRDPVVTSIQFASDATLERFTLTGVFDDRGSTEKVTTITYRSPDASYTVTAGGNITERANAHDGTVTSVVISASGYSIRLTGKFALDGDEITDVTTLTGNVTAISVNGAGGTISISGIAIPIDVVQGIGSLGDIFTVVAPYLTGNDSIAYNSSLGMVLEGGPGNDTISGGSALDTLVGGTGDDHFILRSLDDSVIVENPGEGSDTARLAWNVNVPTTIDVALFENVENLLAAGTGAFHLTGDAADNALTGNASANALTGGDGNDTLDGRGGVDTMTGGLGDDYFVVDRASDVVLENADEGSDTVRVTYATKTARTLDLGTLYGGYLEGLHTSGAGPWRLLGNERDNVLTGNASDNRLTGGAGNDTMAGGKGNDTYFVDSEDDVVLEAAKAGTDTVRSASNFVLGANVENLILTGAGGLAGIGNASRNVITGNAGDDTLEGGGGNDTLRGGPGNDLYVVGVGADSIVEASGGGEDTVHSVASFSIAALPYLEHLTLTGSAHANATGNGGGNVLTGNDGNNRLDGRGGMDTMSGGLGDDLYVLDRATDVVDEAPDAGNDTVRIAYAATEPTLIDLTAEFDNVERVDVTGTGVFHLAGDGADNALWGNASRNQISGGDGNDTLDGRGGVDTMTGGAGDDFYVLDRASDVVMEDPGGGHDTVRLSYGVTSTTVIDLAVRYGGNIESVHAAGAGVFRLYGNGEGNALTGNSSANVLDGRAGDDTMAGGNGNDTYYVDSPNDVVVEAVNRGTDTARSSAATYSLPANVENLILIGTGQSGTGNALRNAIIGTPGDDTLDGGAGNDTLRGGAGNDTYLVGEGTDTVVEGSGGGEDTIYSSASFSIASLPHVEHLALLGSGNLNGTGNAQANLILGNAGSNLLSGGAGNDSLIGAAGNDTLFGGSGSDYVDGGPGDDTLVWDGEDAGLHGDDGIDTLRIDGSGMLVNLLATSTLTGLEIVSLTGSGNNTLIIDAETVLAIAPESVLRVVGNDGDKIIIGTGWTSGADQIIDGSTYETYTSGGATLLVDARVGSAPSRATPVSDSVPLTGNLLIDFYVQGGSWDFLGAKVLSYSLHTDGGGDWTPELQDAVAAAFAAWSNVADLSFQHIPSESSYSTTKADIAITLVGDLIAPAVGMAVFPDTDVANTFLAGEGKKRSQYPRPEGDIFLDPSFPAFQHLEPGGAGFWVLLHEIGHSLGLKHPGDGGGNGRPTVQGNGFIHDFLFGPYTIMDSSGISADDPTGFGSPMPMDIRAVQMIYGANLSYHTGDDTYELTAASPPMTIWDAGGIDTLDFSAMPAKMDIDLRDGGAYQRGLSFGDFLPYIGIAPGVLIEKIVGTPFNDSILGNDADNHIDGGGGNDAMRGGKGDDTYIVDSTADTVYELPDEGFDVVFASSGHGLAPFVENLTFTGSADVHGGGNDLDNLIVGNDGKNTIGGNGGDDTIIGNAGDDQLFGGAGDDSLDGGTGIDFLRGHDGDDVYVVDDYAPAPAPDSVTIILPTWNNLYQYIEPADGTVTLTLQDVNGDGLVDRLRYSYLAPEQFLSFDIKTYPHGQNIEAGFYDYSLEFTYGGIGASQRFGHFAVHEARFDYTGELPSIESFSLSFLQHNDLPDADPWEGTLNISYDGVSSGPERVHERADEGNDTVKSWISYQAPANVENISLMGAAHNDAIGNDLNNTLMGNAGDNALEGKAGNDTLTGGDGEDRFVFSEIDLDTITDFMSGEDKIVLDSAAFGALTPGGATDGFVLYDEEMGGLYYDADGAGGAAPVQFAALSGAPALAGGDFEVL